MVCKRRFIGGLETHQVVCQTLYYQKFARTKYLFLVIYRPAFQVDSHKKVSSEEKKFETEEQWIVKSKKQKFR